MARGRRGGKKSNKVIRLSLPKKIYYILYGVAGNNEQKLNKLIRNIIEERLEYSTIGELEELLEGKTKNIEFEEIEPETEVEETVEQEQ
ncbi:MAG TPA: hypothetical protein EYP03_03110 [Aquificae bacterium]|nr:hypothetical protein [Aquificota bacterium]